MRFLKLLFILNVLLCANIFAQDITIKGTVSSDEDKTTIPGATVVVKGTKTGTQTDLDGNFTIVASPTATLIFSFVGMETKEVAVNNQKNITVSLKQNAVDLGEMVVVGYNSDSKKLISGSFGVVNNKELQQLPQRTLDAVLQGRSPGVQINQNSGTPGGAMSIKIRGGSSINASNEPLYVIDGVPIIRERNQTVGVGGQNLSALSDLSPNDIESVTILKDASATAIYGARASNGVVLITTKKGIENKGNVVKNITLVDLGVNYGWQQLPSERKLKMLNAKEYSDYKGIPLPDPKINTDWVKEVTQTAPMSTYDLSLTGGSDKTRYCISGTYYNQVGIVKGTEFERYNGRINVDQKATDKITFGGSVALTHSFNKRVRGDNTLNGPLPNAISDPPIFAVKNTDGTYNETGLPYANPVAIAMESVNEATNYRTISSIYGDFKIFKGLSFNTKMSSDMFSFKEHLYDPTTTRLGRSYNGRGIESNSNVSNIVSSNVLLYNTSINKVNNIDLMIGNSFEKFERKTSSIEGINFPDERFKYLTSASTISSAYATSMNRGMNSYFGQAKYNYAYKYIFQFTARADGSSRFGKNNRYGYFPAASIAWRMNEEKFIKKIKFINELKLRFSYGLTGNDDISDFQSLSLYSGGRNYDNKPGIAPTQLENPDLKWETQLNRNIGVDFSCLKERITINFDYYFNKTQDLLYQKPLPLSSGYSSIWQNIGELENTGVELTLTTINIDKEFKWTSSFNISSNTNKVTKLLDNRPLIIGEWSNNSIIVGEPVGVFWGYKSLGVDPSTGDIVFEDKNKDGKITSEDMMKIGNPNPKFSGGFNNNFSYKRFEIAVFIQYTYGNDVFNATRRYIEALKYSDNQTEDILRMWKKPGDITDIPRKTDDDPNNNNRISSRFVEDGSFLKIKTVTLSYSFDSKKLEKFKIRTIKAFVTVQNLYTFTKYKGMDPEVNYAGNDNIVIGTDFFTFPQARSLNFGFNIGF